MSSCSKSKPILFSPACQKYFEKYPGDNDLLWEVEGVGHRHQRTLVASILEREALQYIGKIVVCMTWIP